MKKSFYNVVLELNIGLGFSEKYIINLSNFHFDDIAKI